MPYCTLRQIFKCNYKSIEFQRFYNPTISYTFNYIDFIGFFQYCIFHYFTLEMPVAEQVCPIFFNVLLCTIFMKIT